MLNEEGGYEADITVTRVSNIEFLLVSSSGSVTRDLLWIRKIIEEKGFRSVVTDVTSAYSILGLMRPKSRDLLMNVIEENKEEVIDKSLPFGNSKEIAFGMARVRVNRISYVGTLGFELVGNFNKN
jgi:4-methylaminobutanoate oxidase (formaldehyde-forming)